MQEYPTQSVPANCQTGSPELDFRRVLERLPAATYTCNAEGLITYFNHRAVDVWGRAPKLLDPADRYCGSHKILTVDGEPLPLDQCWMALAISEGKGFNDREVVIERPDGSRLNVLGNANPIFDESGRVIGAVNMLVDITEHTLLEQRLQQAQTMEAIGRLADGVAHEISSLLNLIAGYAEVLATTSPTGDIPQFAVQGIQKAAHRAAAMTSRLSALGRQQELRSEVTCLDHVVARLELLLKTLAGKQVDILMFLKSSPLQVQIDPDQFEKVVVRLVERACAAMAHVGQIILTVQSVQLSKEDCGLQADAWPGEFVQVSINDSGPVLAADMLEHLFEPFSSAKEWQAGLELASVYGVVKQMGGFITASSHKETGTTFCVHFPVTRCHHVPGES